MGEPTLLGERWEEAGVDEGHGGVDMAWRRFSKSTLSAHLWTSHSPSMRQLHAIDLHQQIDVLQLGLFTVRRTHPA